MSCGRLSWKLTGYVVAETFECHVGIMSAHEPVRLTDTGFAAVARALADPRRYSILTGIAASTEPLPAAGCARRRISAQQ